MTNRASIRLHDRAGFFCSANCDHRRAWSAERICADVCACRHAAAAQSARVGEGAGCRPLIGRDHRDGDARHSGRLQRPQIPKGSVMKQGPILEGSLSS